MCPAATVEEEEKTEKTTEKETTDNKTQKTRDNYVD